ncbi:MAG: DUF4332 domain-containing protein [Hyphomicrobium sp.]
MSALFRIVYAAHANGTHHKLALDALTQMRRPDAEAWRRVFLKHVALYLEGSKAPDVSFKDFKNHVLHVGDKYWGGAPEKVEAWYGHTVTALSEQKWGDAAYAAGVMSHYYTDPIHPFHTGQTEAENAIHRACEWSINRSYDALRAIGSKEFAALRVEVPEGAHWLRELVCDGAEFSHRYYEKLIAHYDFKRGVVRPEEGLDAIAQKLVAELLMYAADGFAQIVDRAIAESGATAPDVALTVDTVLAAAKMPRKWIEKKLTNNADKALVNAQYDELAATGRVDQTLSEDDRTVRDTYAREVLAPKLKARAETRAKRVPEGDPAELARKAEVKAAPVAPAATAGAAKSFVVSSVVPMVAPPRTAVKPAMPPPIPTSVPVIRPNPVSKPVSEPRRSYLSKADQLEAAPSIGPKMAERFSELGIKTVAEFLGNDPHDMAELLDDSRIDAEELTDWQDQAQLVIDIAGLRGGHAQLLVGAGYRTAEAIADAEPVELASDVLKFAATSDGKRILREGDTPDVEKIKTWVTFAREALAA